MIKNIIFDIGGVLTRFDPNDFLSAFDINTGNSKEISNAIFKNEFWKAYMKGDVTPDEFKSSVLKLNPHLKNIINVVLDKKILIKCSHLFKAELTFY